MRGEKGGEGKGGEEGEGVGGEGEGEGRRGRDCVCTDIREYKQYQECMGTLCTYLLRGNLYLVITFLDFSFLVESEYRTYNIVQYYTVQYSTEKYNTVQYYTEQCSAVQYYTIQYSIVQYSTAQWYMTYICGYVFL